MKKIFTLILTLAVFIVLAGCGNQATPQAKDSKTTVSVAMLRLTSTAPLFIAMDKGYFAKENIEIKPEWFEAAHPIAVATASGKVDVGATGITASLYNMAAMGQKLAIVADKGRVKTNLIPPRKVLFERLNIFARIRLHMMIINYQGLRL